MSDRSEPQDLECRWWQLRWVGKSFGATLLSSAIVGAVTAFLKPGRRDQNSLRFGTYFGCSLFAVAGAFFIQRKYWNDPAELQDERKKFEAGRFREFYQLHGWERLFKIAGGRSFVHTKLQNEMKGMGLFVIWNQYSDVLDDMLKYDMISHNEILSRFMQDEDTRNVSAIERMNKYGTWIVKTLNVPPQQILTSVTLCHTTSTMTFDQLCMFQLKDLWTQGFIGTDFLRLKIFPELESRWFHVQNKSGHWWLDLGLVQIPEVQAYFDNTWRKEEQVESFINKFWEWPISQHSGLLPEIIFRGLQRINVDYVHAESTHATKKKEIKSEYNKIESRADEQRARAISEIDDKWENQKANLRSMYSDNDAKYNAQVAQEQRSVTKQLQNARESYERRIEDPKKKRDNDLKALESNYQLIKAQIQENYNRLRLTGEAPRPIIDPTNPLTFLPSLLQPTPVIVQAPALAPVIVNIITSPNNGGTVFQ